MTRKLTLVLLLLVLLLPLRADNLLANGDFSQGAANWDGYGQNNDSGLPNFNSTPSSATAKGLTLQLDQNNWTHLSQIVHTSEDSLKCTVVWRLSADCSLITDAAQGKGATMSAETFGNLTGYNYGYHMPVKGGAWILMGVKCEPGMPKNPWFPIEIPLPKGDATKQQTATFDLKLGSYADKKIVLAFPPGQGSITLLNVTLTSPKAPASVASAPTP